MYCSKFICGGPMMGLTMSSLDVPICKNNNALVALTTEPVAIAQEKQTACIRCGRCNQVCPLGLTPQMMASAAQRKDYDSYENKLYCLECIACGACAYISPGHMPGFLASARRSPVKPRRLLSSFGAFPIYAGCSRQAPPVLSTFGAYAACAWRSRQALPALSAFDAYTICAGCSRQAPPALSAFGAYAVCAWRSRQAPPAVVRLWRLRHLCGMLI